MHLLFFVIFSMFKCLFGSSVTCFVIYLNPNISSMFNFFILFTFPCHSLLAPSVLGLQFENPTSKKQYGFIMLLVYYLDASCELCGFYFENRKALASHARAHLRQFGVTEWCVNGSPIETLSAWIRSRPQKAAEMQQSYAQGARYTQKKARHLMLHCECMAVIKHVFKTLLHNIIC